MNKNLLVYALLASVSLFMVFVLSTNQRVDPDLPVTVNAPSPVRALVGGEAKDVKTALPLPLTTTAAFAEPEICGNGIDDDEDGFVDSFDTDCPCSTTGYGSYVSNCTPSCSYQFVAQPFAIAEQWSSAPNVGMSYNTPLIADLDNDGVSEVIAQTSNGYVGSPRVVKDLFILNGENGTLQTTITTPYMDWSSTVVVAIADVDNDGQGEIIVASSTSTNPVADRQYLYCYKLDNTLLWKSNVQYAANAPRSGGAPGIADFNHDGVAEVYIYNEIFNAQTGVKLADGGANGVGVNFSNGNVATWANSVAADFLPSSPELELAAGRTVYSVSITNTAGTAGNVMTPTSLPGALDGITSAADVNLDGVLDVVVTPSSSTQGLYVWDARTATVIASQAGALSGSSAGVAFIGDVDNDGDPDIGYCRINRLYMLSYNGTATLDTKWVLTTTDVSGVTGLSMFDFNQDGKAEVVYRDETQLRIIDGSTSTPTNLAVITSRSFTALEMPVVADIDHDGQAEIVIGDQTGLPTAGTGHIKAYKSNAQPWAPARNVWNQLGYHNTNIDDALRVPRFEQNHSYIFTDVPGPCAGATQRPLNNFLQQASPRGRDGCLAYPSSDATVTNISVACQPGNKLDVTYTVSNIGEAPLDSAVTIRFYAGNPLTSPGTVFPVIGKLGTILAFGESKVMTTTVDFSGTPTPFDIFVAVNDDGLSPRPFTFPTTSIAECNYGNNVSNAIVVGCIEICDNGLDDDGDGLADCEDPDCYLAANTGGTDTDLDGIDNHCDVDDDNDGVLDTDEGCVAGVTGLVCTLDTDGDGLVDSLDPDSDNDGCVDAREAGHTDPDGDGKLGTSPLITNIDGTVNGQGGYTGGPSAMRQATLETIQTPPGNQTVAIGDNVTFTIAATSLATTSFTSGTPNFAAPPATDNSAALKYQWQEDRGSGFSNITDGGIYSGALTSALTLTGVSDEDGFSYRVVVTSSDNLCFTEQRSATLSISPLPVTLISFTGAPGPEGNVLKWRTAGEVNFDRFIIQRSTDLLQGGFTDITEIDGGKHQYETTDRRSPAGISYYRLKMLDLDGTFELSKIVNVNSLDGAGEHAIVMYPNPAVDNRFYIKNYSNVQSFRVVNSGGQQVEAKVNLENSDYVLRLPQDAAKGIYLFIYTINNQQFTRKLVVR